MKDLFMAPARRYEKRTAFHIFKISAPGRSDKVQLWIDEQQRINCEQKKLDIRVKDMITNVGKDGVVTICLIYNYFVEAV